MTVAYAGALLFGASSAAGQVERFCPTPRYTLETFKERLIELAKEGSYFGGFIARALTPGLPPGCPALSESQDLQGALQELVRFAAAQDDSRVAKETFSGILVALLANGSRTTQPAIPMGSFSPQRRWTFVPGAVFVPVTELAHAVESGRSVSNREAALWTTISLLPDSRLEAYLLKWARALRGPPDFPDLPQKIVLQIYARAAEPNAGLRAALEASVDSIANATARCWVLSHGRPTEVAPGSRSCTEHSVAWLQPPRLR